MESRSYFFRVFPVNGEQWTYQIEKPVVRIGRASHCDLVIDDHMVSREHCLFALGPEGPTLEDLSSFNGTLVNNARITQCSLKPGDMVRLGLCELMFDCPEGIKRVQSSETTKSQMQQPALISLTPADEPLPHVLVIHPDCSCIEELLSALKESGAVVHTIPSREKMLGLLHEVQPDCFIVCADMQNVSGVCQSISEHEHAGPIILLTNQSSWPENWGLLQTGVDEVLTRPDRLELLVRVKRMVELHRLRHMAKQKEIAADHARDDAHGNKKLKRLEKYLSPQIVNVLLSEDKSQIFQPVRRELTTVFCDLRNYTHFSEVSEPEEIMSMLSDFHRDFGEVVLEYDGTLERFAGDGILTFFGAPVAYEDHALRAVSMAVAARDKLKRLMSEWRKLGYGLDVAFGIATGHVFVGNIGFKGRMDYAAIGKTTNLAARLCSAAKGGQILISQRTLFFVESMVEVEEMGALQIKGFSTPVSAYNVAGLKTSSPSPK